MSPVFFIAVLIGILQLTAVTYARTGPSGFNLDIITLAFFGFKYGWRTGLGLGIFFGILSAVFSTRIFLSNVLIYAAIGLIIGYLGRWFYKDNIFAFVLIALCSLSAINFFNSPAHLFGLFLRSALYNAFISVFLFYFFRGINA
ncbi:MAG: hypothetical protein HY589_03060 [Candidatus Omnitrophica bacterium]|nr:hypothetical protein [Candidatus Omnitrophota bacterium]